ncbi:MAG: DUF692 family multinuclear iron-containing protein [Thermodesulfobacteriota bacterium]
MLMFRVCLPISHLLEQDSPPVRKILAQADVLELRRPILPEFIPAKPRVFHSGLGLVQEEFLSSFRKEGLDRFLDEAGIKMFSFDLGPSCRRNQYILPLSRTLALSEIKSEMARSLEAIRKSYQGQLAAENYNYYPSGLYEHICRPDVIAHLLEFFDLKLVLDLAHATITAANLNLNLKDYLAELPLDQTVEIHLSRPYLHPRIAVDAHAGPGADDYRLLGYVLDHLPHPEEVLVAIEYYRDLKRLSDHYCNLIEFKSRLKSDPHSRRTVLCRDLD